MKKLLSYLHSRYKEGEPIFIKDIKIDGLSKSTIRVYFKRLVDSGKIRKKINGIYYFPLFFKEFDNSELSIDEDSIIFRKYICKDEKIFGYYTGSTFANICHVSVQFPFVKSIRTNNTTSIKRTIKIGNFTYIIRKSYVKITNENFRVLQLLDLLKDLDIYIEDGEKKTRETLASFVNEYNITLEDVKKYIGYFPKRVYKTIFEGGYYNVFIQQPHSFSKVH